MNAEKQFESWISESVSEWSRVFEACSHCPAVTKSRGFRLPHQKDIVKVLNNLIELLFPGCMGEFLEHEGDNDGDGKLRTSNAAQGLYECILPVIKYYCNNKICKDCGDCKKFSENAVKDFFSAGTNIREMLRKDITAAYEGDPAATSELEIVMSYPGLYAISVHRIAHRLIELNVPLIPRVMSEHAHLRTGIDIHPGAKIGEGFFVDHGTGVVIGGTCVLGNNVKLYQGVTLGALSFAKDEQGNLIKGIKRHPNVEDNVVIYAGATILGGDTVIGHDSVIGGNVWLTKSVPPFSKVYNQQPEPLVKTTR